MLFTFVVSVDTERVSGPFASREDLSEQLRDAITDADPGELEGANGGVYEVTFWEVTG